MLHEPFDGVDDETRDRICLGAFLDLFPGGRAAAGVGLAVWALAGQGFALHADTVTDMAYDPR